MKRIGLLIGFLAILVFVLPTLTAQDEKKVEKTEKKDIDKKDDKKDPEKPEKKEEKKKAEPKKEKLVSQKPFYTKILTVKADSNRDFTIETMVQDMKKVAEVQTWVQQQQQALGQQAFQTQKGDFKARAAAVQAYQKALYNYQVELAKKNVFSAKPVDVVAAETAKVRSIAPPVEFDDVGVEKKWTKKELAERKDKTGLPGYPVDFDAIKPGQNIEIYLAKQTPAKKADPKKKGPADDDPPEAKKDRLEYVLIVIQNSGGK